MIDIPSLADGPLFGLPLEELWFGILFFVFGMFVFLDGFDFGIGILFGIHTDEDEQEQLLATVTPFWDGNEVWLVVFGGMLFAAFPTVYANLFSRHYLLMFAILAALGLRGLAPEMYEQREDTRWQTWWGRAFVVGSLATPFCLGLFTTNWLVGASALVTLPGIIVGSALVALTVVDGIAFVRLKVRGSLRETLKADANRAIAGYLVFVVSALSYLFAAYPNLRPKLLSPIVAGLIIATLVFAGGYTVATRIDRYYLAFASVAGLVFSFIGIVAGTMYPFVDRAAGLTVGDAIVSPLPLNIMTIGTALFLPLIFGYFAVLYSAFSGPIEAGESY